MKVLGTNMQKKNCFSVQCLLYNSPTQCRGGEVYIMLFVFFLQFFFWFAWFFFFFFFFFSLGVTFGITFPILALSFITFFRFFLSSSSGALFLSTRVDKLHKIFKGATTVIINNLPKGNKSYLSTCVGMCVCV